MPKPGDELILTATLIPTMGSMPVTHSCSVSVFLADDTPVVASTPMVNVTGAIYKLVLDTTGWALGAYYAVYESVIDGLTGPPLCENFYLELAGIDPSDLAVILAALSAIQADTTTILNLTTQIWYTTWCHKQESLEYDSQGRVELNTTTFAETPDFGIPVAIFVWSFTYNADNSIATLTIERTFP